MKKIDIKAFIKKYDFILICMLIAAINLLFSMRVSGRQSLGMDEIAEIGFVSKYNSLGKILNYFLTVEITNLPFYALFAAIWYRIVPYGESWLLLFNELCTYLGIIFVALAAKQYKGKRAGYLACVLCTSSSTIILRCGMEFRSYAFLFMFGALVIWLYLKRYEVMGRESRKDVIVLGLAMACLAYSHYFGCLLIVGLFLGDFVLYLLKKIKWYNIFSYIMAGGLLFPWFVAMLIFKEKSIMDFWPKAPNFGDLPYAIQFALSKDEILFVLFLVAMGFILGRMVVGFFTKKYSFEKDFGSLVLLETTWFIVLVAFFYSAYINPYGGIWVDKYFVSIIPLLLIVISSFLSDVTDVITDREDMRSIIAFGIGFFIFAYVGVSNYYYDVKDYLATPLDPYREVRDFCLEQGDAYDDTTLIVTTNQPYMADSYNEYYFEYSKSQKGARVISEDDESLTEELGKSDKVYLFEVRTELEDEYKPLFDDFKKVSYDKDLGLTVYERSK